jgi:hypothetical protein
MDNNFKLKNTCTCSKRRSAEHIVYYAVHFISKKSKQFFPEILVGVYTDPAFILKAVTSNTSKSHNSFLTSNPF